MTGTRIEDHAIVIRGGRNRPEDIARGIAIHPSGITGISVHASHECDLHELAIGIPHGQIGVTTTGAIREAGGEVLRTSGRSPYHATVTGLDPITISHLLTPTITNPSRKEAQ